MSTENINQQYTTHNLFEKILDTIETRDIAKDSITQKQISAFDEFHIRGREVTLELINELNLNSNAQVLDVGCGLGGPCRQIAVNGNCMVVGLDVNPEYIRTAKKLSELVNLDADTDFIEGSALDLPFEPQTFDVVITQHVQMNIKDKERFYSEIYRVLKPSGQFLYYDVLEGNGKDLYYPLPWANKPSINYLIKPGELELFMEKTGFSKVRLTDQTQKGLLFLTEFLKRSEKMPAILSGQNILMEDNAKEKILNIQKCIIEQRIALQSGIWNK